MSSGFTNIIQTVGEAVVAAPAYAFPNPPTADGCVLDVENQYGVAAEVEVTISAGGTTQLSAGAFLCAEEVVDHYPEESNAVQGEADDEKFTYNSHGFYTGDGPVHFKHAAGALPTNVSASTSYWVIRTEANKFQIATSRANALAGTAVNLGTDGSNVSVYWVTGVKSESQDASAIDATANTYTIVGHGLVDDQVVQVANSGGALPTGLSANTDYYVIVVDDDTISFSATEGGAAINWSDGSGTQSVIANFLAPTATTIFSKFAILNAGEAIDLTATVGYRERLSLRPGIVALHLVATSSAWVPLTLQAQGIRYKE